MNWLRESISDGRSGRASSKRIAMLIATLALAAAVLILAAAGFIGRDVAMALGSVAAPLAVLGGASYVGGKYAERSKKPDDGGSDVP